MLDRQLHRPRHGQGQGEPPLTLATLSWRAPPADPPPVAPLFQLVGLTMNCVEGATDIDWLNIKVGDPNVRTLRHLQAMLLATDRTGVELLLVDAGLSGCHSDYIEAIQTEIRLTSLITQAGYKVDALMSLFRDSDKFADTCTSPNPFDDYPGGFLHPHETLFVKSRAGTPPELIEQYSHFARDYHSRKFCTPGRRRMGMAGPLAE